MKHINIQINGKHIDIGPQETLKDALDSWASNAAARLSAPYNFAVALNHQFVPRTQYEATTLKAGDEIELLVPMSGG
jgi:sulfur carrier protein